MQGSTQKQKYKLKIIRHNNIGTREINRKSSHTMIDYKVLCIK